MIAMYDYYNTVRVKDVALPLERPSLVTGVGHGHFRKASRERPKKNIKAKRRQREKMTKASKRRNRKC